MKNTYPLLTPRLLKEYDKKSRIKYNKENLDPYFKFYHSAYRFILDTHTLKLVSKLSIVNHYICEYCGLKFINDDNDYRLCVTLTQPKLMYNLSFTHTCGELLLLGIL